MNQACSKLILMTTVEEAGTEEAAVDMEIEIIVQVKAGGYGWTFTESSLKEFLSGDSTNASKFVLTSTYYLTYAKCIGCNEEFPRPDGNGNERCHSGHGYAKITPL